MEQTTEQTAVEAPEEQAPETPEATYANLSAKYGANTANKLQKTIDDRKAEIDKARKALNKAQQEYDDAPIGKEEKAEAKLAKAQDEYDAALAEYDYWTDIKAVGDKIAADNNATTEVAGPESAPSEESVAEVETKPAVEEKSAANSNIANGKPLSPYEQAKIDLADSPVALDMLDDLEPRSLDEVAAVMLSSTGDKKGATRLMFHDEGGHKGFSSMTGYKWSDVKGYPFIFASREKGGISFEAFGDAVVAVAKEEGLMFDESDAMAGVNAASEMFGYVSKQGDINNYIANKRIKQAYDYYEEELRMIDSMMREDMGVTTDEYKAWVEYMEQQAAAVNGMTEEEYYSSFMDGMTDEEYNNLIIQQNNERTTETDNGTDREESAGTLQGQESIETGTPNDDTGGVEEDTAGAAAESGRVAERPDVQANAPDAVNGTEDGELNDKREVKPAKGETEATPASEFGLSDFKREEIDQDIADGRVFERRITDAGKVQHISVDYLRGTERTINERQFKYAQSRGGIMQTEDEYNTLVDEARFKKLQDEFIRQFPHREIDDVISSLENSNSPVADYNREHTLPWIKELKALSETSTERRKRIVSNMEAREKEAEARESAERVKSEPAGEAKQEVKAKSEPKRLVSDERMEELKKKLRKKLNGQLNVGVDPELLAIGAEIAVGHIERGLTKFADFAKNMIAEIGDVIRPYLKAFYNAVRDMPEAQDYASEMDSYQDVSAFDVLNFDKTLPAGPIETAQHIVDERKVESDVKAVVDEVKSSRKQKKTSPNEKKDVSLQSESSGQLGCFLLNNIIYIISIFKMQVFLKNIKKTL